MGFNIYPCLPIPLERLLPVGFAGSPAGFALAPVIESIPVIARFSIAIKLETPRADLRTPLPGVERRIAPLDVSSFSHNSM